MHACQPQPRSLVLSFARFPAVCVRLSGPILRSSPCYCTIVTEVDQGKSKIMLWKWAGQRHVHNVKAMAVNKQMPLWTSL